MSALATPQSNSPDKIAHDWAVIAARAPRLAATLGRYLAQASTFLAPPASTPPPSPCASSPSGSWTTPT